ncbi:DUF397 domain-containing protein [Streptomyces varsoviensis]|uniref:DUF397 domain-containing protein n=1 Tax=Streptomyces varsoviensis TaxID=67373 RepID=A0ABR5JEX8_9ACTN|nr:DUF397 domain-containing protein [Streptomyces varsoviensis]KOG91970.1 hypothetical protein ADK38_00230 [Streptomyces varsoviensis]
MPELSWQKSSFSTDQANCVELATSPAGIHLRESDAPEAIVTAKRPALRAFVRAVRTDTVKDRR